MSKSVKVVLGGKGSFMCAIKEEVTSLSAAEQVYYGGHYLGWIETTYADRTIHVHSVGGCFSDVLHYTQSRATALRTARQRLLLAQLERYTPYVPPEAPAEDPAPEDNLAGQPERAFPSSAIDPAFGGMSLWDWYAGQALAGACANTEMTYRAEWAAHAADAMMAEREKRKGACAHLSA